MALDAADATAYSALETPRILKIGGVYRSKLRDDLQGIEGDRINEFDLVYKDDLSISLSTAYLFNYRLPLSLTISLSVFSRRVSFLMFSLLAALIQAERAVVTPSPSPPAPVLTLTVLSNFTLGLQPRSLLGSRAKLADVPKPLKLT
ncbi:hypothetical protein EDB83DRAFT_2517931 [Lactarius deliciosus]|nr:hypothetical protein EDB83DRAFT_2517931 [Lactarius deliciosus]